MIELLLLMGLFAKEINPDLDQKKDDIPMLRAFNSFQMVVAFAGMPFLISWLADQTFKFSGAAIWVASIVYLISFIMMCIAVYDGLDSKKW